MAQAVPDLMPFGDAGEIDYRSLLESAPGLFLVLTPDLRVVTANDAYLSARSTTRQKIQGKHLFDIVPIRPEARDTHVTEPPRYWSLRSLPVLGADRRVKYIILQILQEKEVRDLPHLQEVEIQLKRGMEELARAKKDLHWNERRYRAIFDHSMDAVMMTSPSGDIVMANRAAIEMFGYTEDELKALGRLALADLSDPRLRASIEERRRTGSFQGELILRRKDGMRFPVEISSTIFSDESGSEWTSTIMRNISKRKRAEAEREKAMADLDNERRWFQAVFEGSPLGMLMFRSDDPDHPIPNAYARTMFGSSIDWKVGRVSYLRRAFTPAGRPLTQDELISQRVLRGETVIGEEQLFRTNDGREYPIVLAGGPIEDRFGKRIGAVAFFQDISALKELQRLREEWAAIIAHDLRQPITTIQLQASLLENLPGVSEKAKRLAILIGSSAKHLNRMTQDLLEISQAEACKLRLEFQRIDVILLMRDLIEKLRPMYPDNPITLEIKGGVPEIEADPGRLEQVIGNLVSNASKYGFTRTEIGISIRRIDPGIEISVTNRGPGIPPDDLGKLFQRFHRTQLAEKERVKGVGLGLYITKRLVEAHDGRIRAESVPGDTTVFRFELPLSQPGLREQLDAA